MIDINSIVSQALAAAVEETAAPLLERIAALESQSADRHARLRVLEGALTDRVNALEKRLFEDLGGLIEQEFIASMAVTDVVGHDTVQALTDRVAFLESQAIVVSNAADKRITELETKTSRLLEYWLEY